LLNYRAGPLAIPITKYSVEIEALIAVLWYIIYNLFLVEHLSWLNSTKREEKHTLKMAVCICMIGSFL